MANTVTLRTLIDGPRNTIIHAYFKSDGAAGELTDQVIVDVSTLSPVPTKVTIESLWWDFEGFSGLLEFDATADTPGWKLQAGTNGHKDFYEFGGIKDNTGAGSTGDIVMTTSGFTAATDEGTLIIKVRKD